MMAKAVEWRAADQAKKRASVGKGNQSTIAKMQKRATEKILDSIEVGDPTKHGKYLIDTLTEYSARVRHSPSKIKRMKDLIERIEDEMVG